MYLPINLCPFSVRCMGAIKLTPFNNLIYHCISLQLTNIEIFKYFDKKGPEMYLFHGAYCT